MSENAAAAFAAYQDAIGPATSGLAAVSVVRATASVGEVQLDHTNEFAFWFILDGSVTLEADGHDPVRLGESDSCTVPAGHRARFTGATPDLRMLVVRVPN